MNEDADSMFGTLLVMCVFLTGNALQNLSVGKSANHTDTLWGGTADRAVDGSTRTEYNHRSCTHTAATTNALWEVDLGKIYRIDHIIVFGRTDCCAERLREVLLFIGVDRSPDDYVLRGFYAEVLPVPYTFQLTSPVYGRWMKITRSPTVNGLKDQLSLCEVEVMGAEITRDKFELVDGKIGTGNILQTSRASTKSDGCIQCIQIVKCCAVNYNLVTKVCEKLETVFTKDDFSEDSSFYRRP